MRILGKGPRSSMRQCQEHIFRGSITKVFWILAAAVDATNVVNQMLSSLQYDWLFRIPRAQLNNVISTAEWIRSGSGAGSGFG